MDSTVAIAGAPQHEQSCRVTFAIVAGAPRHTNRLLAEACWRLGVPTSVLTPGEAERRLRPGDVALGRLDVLPTVDGVEPGLPALRRLAARGVRVLNGADALLLAHDKLATAGRLARCGVAHPRTMRLTPTGSIPRVAPPVVVKPRFGSWGRDVHLCRTRAELVQCVAMLRQRRWFRRHGALAQELVRPRGYDLRVLVAGDRVVGAVKRVAPPHEWRTNVELGARRQRVRPPAPAVAVAVAAAHAIRADFVGIDLLPVGAREWVVIEVNGAVDFTAEYTLDDGDVFEQVARRLAAQPPAAVALPG